MDTEFHYWMTAIIAERAGFSEKEAATIAYASEYVDENDVAIKVSYPDGSGRKYYNFVSQTMNITKPRRELMRIYPIFHFMPGDPQADTARRRDGHMHILNTTPDSKNARTLFDAAFAAPKSHRLHRIGVATHMYADTWAHQNFVGWFDSHNHQDGDLKPNIGHADAEHHPDWPGHRWEDERMVNPTVDNRARFLDAAEAIFRRYCRYQVDEGKADRAKGWGKLKKDLAVAMGPSFSGNKNYYEKQRMASYKKLAPWLEPFDEMTWFNEAIKTRVYGLRDSADGLGALFTLLPDSYTFRKPNPASTDWYRFQQAVKAHEADALNVLEPLFKQMNVDIRTS